MPQNSIKPPIIGAYSALRGDIWKFVSHSKQKTASLRFAAALGKMDKTVPLERRGKIVFEQRPCTINEVLESALIELTNIAISPSVLVAEHVGSGVVTPALFARLFAAEPDFILAVLAFIRRRWRPSRTSKATRLFHFIADAHNHYIKPLPHQKPRPISTCTDGEIATAFKHSPQGAPVEIDDVVQARRKVARVVYQSLSVARRFKLPPQPVNYLYGPKVERIPLKPGFSRWPVRPKALLR